MVDNTDSFNGNVTNQSGYDDSRTAIHDSVFNMSIYEQKYWLESEVALSIITALAVYTFICISIYASKKRKKPTREIGGGKEGKRLYLMLVLASGFAVLRLISDHVVAFTSSYSDDFCFATLAVSTVLYAFGLFSVYIFLWMRQNIFYANPVLSKVLNKAVTLASWCCLVLMIISAICLTILYNVPYVNGWDYQVVKDEGCKGVLVGNGEIVAGIATAMLTTFQILLLILFVYPLLSRKTQKYRSAGNAASSANGVSHVSGSNTDDNGTDAEHSAYSKNHAKCKIVKSLSSENESGVDVSEPVYSPQTFSNAPAADECSRNESVVNPSKLDRTRSIKSEAKNDSARKSNLFTRIQKPGKIFYKREHGKVSERNGDQVKLRNSALPPAKASLKERPLSSAGSVPKKSKAKRSRSHQGRRMMAFLKKAFILMLICIVTDIVSTVVQAQVNLPEIVYLVMFDLNLMINIVCIVMSFRDWDAILFPMFVSCKARKRNRTDSEDSSGSSKRKGENPRGNGGFSTHLRAARRTPGSSLHRDSQINDYSAKQLDLNGKT